MDDTFGMTKMDDTFGNEEIFVIVPNFVKHTCSFQRR